MMSIQDDHSMRMNIFTARAHILIGISLLLSMIPFAQAQENVALTRPAILTLFRPFTSTDDNGNFVRLPFTLSLNSTVGYDDNVSTTHSNQIESGFNGLSLAIGSHVGNQRTILDADVSFGIIYYWDRPGRKYDPDMSLNLKFTHQFNPRLVLGISSFMTYQTQPDFSTGTGQLKNVGDYFYTTEQITLGFQWSRRLSTVTSYSLSTYYYDAAIVAAQQNRVEQVIGQQIRYQLYPTVTAAFEYRFSYVNYETANTDSYSNFVLAGADFTLSPKLSFAFRGGAEFRHQLGIFAGDSIFPYFESTLSYQYRPGSFVKWYNRYGLEETDFGFNTGSKKTFRSGLQISHSLGNKLKAGLSAYYTNSQFNAPTSVTENALDITGSLSYAVTQKFSVQLGYTYTQINSDLVLDEYTRNRVYLGATYAF